MTAFATHQRFGFGVDETTALMVRQESDKTYFKVVGERGVFISDLSVHDYRQVSAEGNVMRTMGGLAHFWPTGTRAVLNNQGFEVTWPTSKSTSYAYQDESQWRLSLARHCKQGKAVSWQYQGVTYMVQVNAATDFYKSGRQCGYANLPFVVSR